MKRMSNQDWLLLVIKNARAGGLTPVQLQKGLFLLGKGVKKAVDYHFVPYNYGPFAKEIYSDAEFLQACGLVDIARPIGRRYDCYSITPGGLARAKELEKKIPPDIKEYLKKLVSVVQSLSFDQLLRAIYRKFPAFKVNSVFQE